jgi:hypothetical protein
VRNGGANSQVYQGVLVWKHTNAQDLRNSNPEFSVSQRDCQLLG